MRALPVLDLKNGLVVRGVAGRRDDYRPVISKITPSAVPVDVARAFRDHFGLAELYLADLDAIAGTPPALGTYDKLHRDGFRLWIDAGIREEKVARVLATAGIEGIVAGLETLAGPETLWRLCQEHGERLVFSLDLKGGRPLARSPAWKSPDPWAIARQAVEACGVRRVVVLDLARVGVGEGTGTESLCRQLAEQFPHVELTAGGGVRDLNDLRRLGQCGVARVLVASALHDGRLTRQDLLAFDEPARAIAEPTFPSAGR
jgi:phosphoribosylformimino-5-aminoimidazole carboxamide ribotide isomerase